MGVDTCEAVGGTLLRNLLQGGDGGGIEDPARLDRLVTEALRLERKTSRKGRGVVST